MDDEDQRSSWKWLLSRRYLGTVLLDFRPGWDCLSHLEQPVSLQEFEERLARCPINTGANESFVQKTIDP